MKITVGFKLNLKTKEATEQVHKATKAALRDVITDIAQDAIEHAPPPPKIGTSYVSTGHNKRSIKFEMGPGQPIAKKELEGAVYSTSGYGGFLETGTVKMAARPYFRPALDKNMKKLPKNIKAHLK